MTTNTTAPAGMEVVAVRKIEADPECFGRYGDGTTIAGRTFKGGRDWYYDLTSSRLNLRHSRHEVELPGYFNVCHKSAQYAHNLEVWDRIFCVLPKGVRPSDGATYITLVVDAVPKILSGTARRAGEVSSPAVLVRAIDSHGGIAGGNRGAELDDKPKTGKAA